MENEKDEKIKEIEEKIKALLSNKTISRQNVLISFSDYRNQTFKLSEDWKTHYKEREFRGGFFLDRTIKESLIENYFSHKAEYPVFVVISDNVQEAIHNQSLKDISYTFPESNAFYAVKTDGSLAEFSLQTFEEQQSLTQNIPELKDRKVHQWTSSNGQQYFFPIDGEGGLVVKDFKKVTEQIPGKTAIDRALALDAMSTKMDLMPEETQNLWLPIIKGSFASKIMTPHTSYLVVENEAQEKALLAKQKQVLNSTKAMDTEEIRMSEPELWLILALLLTFIAWRRFKIKIIQNAIL